MQRTKRAASVWTVGECEDKKVCKIPSAITERYFRTKEMVLACALWNNVLRKWEQHFQLNPLKKVR